jgi:hypothetical protein
VRIEEILAKSQGGGALGNLAQSFGIAPDQAEAVLKSVLPELERRMERNTLSRGGVADLVEMLGRAGGGGFIDRKEAIGDSHVARFGVDALDNILGSKDQSRAVAARASRASGISEELIKQMLPVIAAMVMGALAKGAGGTLGEILGKITGAGGRAAPAPVPRAPAPSPVPKLPETGGGWTGGGGSTYGESPLPIPGDDIPGLGRANNPYGDLSDIIRKGGTSLPGGGSAGGGGALSTIIRSVLGALLGFQSRGFIGWLVRLVVMRWGWGIVRWLIGRVLLRR